MKTKEELDALKEEEENMNKELAELTDEELTEVSGGRRIPLGDNSRHRDLKELK